ncbi:MAG: FAD-linked oxidase C-terminal domain-containing protein [Pseudohongiellaceae bacterium]
MELILPRGVDASAFRQALAAFAAIVGADNVLATDEDRTTYLDLYAPGAEAERAHAGFSPILPGSGSEVLAQARRTKARYDEFGIDYSSTMYVCGRHVVNVNLLLYDKDQPALVARSNALFSALVDDASAAGFGEYRTHLSWMDQVAGSFDFNDHALLRLNQRVKDALDPNGILAPGKSGILPQRYREEQA